MNKTQNGFVLQAVIVLIALAAMAIGAYYVGVRNAVAPAMDDQDMVTGETVATATPKEKPPVTKPVVPPAKPPVAATSSKISITLLSPNGGEVWKIGSRQTIRWNLGGTIPTGYKIGIQFAGGFLTQLEATSSSSYSFEVPSSLFAGDVGFTLEPGQYKVQIMLYDGPINHGNGAPGYAWGKIVTYDESDERFSVR